MFTGNPKYSISASTEMRVLILKKSAISASLPLLLLLQRGVKGQHEKGRDSHMGEGNINSLQTPHSTIVTAVVLTTVAINSQQGRRGSTRPQIQVGDRSHADATVCGEHS